MEYRSRKSKRKKDEAFSEEMKEYFVDPNDDDVIFEDIEDDTVSSDEENGQE